MRFRSLFALMPEALYGRAFGQRAVLIIACDFDSVTLPARFGLLRFVNIRFWWRLHAVPVVSAFLIDDVFGAFFDFVIDARQVFADDTQASRQHAAN